MSEENWGFIGYGEGISQGEIDLGIFVGWGEG